MSKINKVVAALVVSLTMSSVASASVITTGTLDFDNVSNVITDNVSGETYLGWDTVKDRDYAQTVAITTGVGFYSDWHIASQTEAYIFYNAASSAGLVDVTGSQSHGSNLGAFADGETYGDSFNASTDSVGFLSDESKEVGRMNISSGRLSIHDNWSSIDVLNTYSGSAGIGMLLVGGTGGATSAVPEPSVIALFGLGLVSIGFARRKRQS